MFRVSDYQSFLRQAGWPEVAVNSKSGVVPLIALMAAIGFAESTGNPGAVNSSGEYSVGLWQININPILRRPWTEAQLKDPLFNAQVALTIYQQQGLNAWGAYKDNRYLKWFNESLALYGQSGSEAAYIPEYGTEADYSEILSINSVPAYGTYEEFLAATQSSANALSYDQFFALQGAQFPGAADPQPHSGLGDVGKVALVFVGLILFKRLLIG